LDRAAELVPRVLHLCRRTGAREPITDAHPDTYSAHPIADADAHSDAGPNFRAASRYSDTYTYAITHGDGYSYSNHDEDSDADADSYYYVDSWSTHRDPIAADYEPDTYHLANTYAYGYAELDEDAYEDSDTDAQRPPAHLRPGEEGRDRAVRQAVIQIIECPVHSERPPPVMTIETFSGLPPPPVTVTYFSFSFQCSCEEIECALHSGNPARLAQDGGE
jgi:hypothetical protein